MKPRTYEAMTSLASKLENIAVRLNDIAILTMGKPRRTAEELLEISKGLLEEEVPYIFDILKNGEKT